MLKGKKILLGITGAISAYKAHELIRIFIKNHAEVKVIATPNALNFVTEVTLRSLSQSEIYWKQYEIDDYKPEHIALTQWADVFLIAPITANTISKLAKGICDNLLTSTACAFKKPVIIAPCMNTNMWENPIIQENLNILKKYSYIIIDPDSGFLACGDIGKGRLANVNLIFEEVKKVLDRKQFLKNKKILITAGGTKENIDAVRYIGN